MKNFIEIGIFVLVLLIIIVSLKKSSFNVTPAQFDPTKQYYIKQKNYFGASDGYLTAYYGEGVFTQTLIFPPASLTMPNRSSQWTISDSGHIYITISRMIKYPNATKSNVYFCCSKPYDISWPIPDVLPDETHVDIIPVKGKQDTYYIHNTNENTYISITPGTHGNTLIMITIPDQTCEFVITPI